MNIYDLRKEHIDKATEVLTVAFKNDPIFKYIFQTDEKVSTACTLDV
ncbi:MAG: hypothetical protein ICV66_12835 [Chitinophagaceae bacterium]|nr:hypothetical protein [Chitinophagaceae bacterium]